MEKTAELVSPLWSGILADLSGQDVEDLEEAMANPLVSSSVIGRVLRNRGYKISDTRLKEIRRRHYLGKA